ncbi:hypothetical protein C8R46DRAFT_1357565, partial [Mycena filopes]
MSFLPLRQLGPRPNWRRRIAVQKKSRRQARPTSTRKTAPTGSRRCIEVPRAAFQKKSRRQAHCASTGKDPYSTLPLRKVGLSMRSRRAAAVMTPRRRIEVPRARFQEKSRRQACLTSMRKISCSETTYRRPASDVSEQSRRETRTPSTCKSSCAVRRAPPRRAFLLLLKAALRILRIPMLFCCREDRRRAASEFLPYASRPPPDFHTVPVARNTPQPEILPTNRRQHHFQPNSEPLEQAVPSWFYWRPRIFSLGYYLLPQISDLLMCFPATSPAIILKLVWTWEMRVFCNW